MMSTAVLALRGDGEERSGGCTVTSLELDEDPEQNTVSRYILDYGTGTEQPW